MIRALIPATAVLATAGVGAAALVALADAAAAARRALIRRSRHRAPATPYVPARHRRPAGRSAR